MFEIAILQAILYSALQCLIIKGNVHAKARFFRLGAQHADEILRRAFDSCQSQASHRRGYLGGLGAVCAL